ncbi:MAG TPA: glycoside hydrolase family 15 protein [Xanthobacteraceae bacterium]
MAKLIEDYGLIGDGETAALVHRNGSIDWLCWPRFDSDACFAALLGGSEHGFWKIAPTCFTGSERRYQTDTLVLETDFEAAEGAVRLVDFMPAREATSVLVRVLKGLRGHVHVRSEIELRFDYGSMRPWIESDGKRAIARAGPDLVVHHSARPIRCDASSIVAETDVSEGDELVFTLAYGSSVQAPPDPIDAKKALAATQRYWRDWIGSFQRPTDWPQAVRRSLITIKALIHRPGGGIIAAPTTSLPEVAGGEKNWDYRFAWLRDATFTLSALLNAGYRQEALEWRNWLLRTLAGDPEKMRIVYRVDGSRRLEDWTAPWLPGFRFASPVRIGNAAAAQRQLDVFGELIDTIHLATQAGIHPSAQELTVVEMVVRHVESVWRLPDHGLWEVRGKPRHYVYSKASAWVAVDRFVRGEALHKAAGENAYARAQRLSGEMHAEICREGYDAGLGRFVEYYGGEKLDASLLLLPLIGFLPINDERIARTIAAVERELMDDGLVYRWRPSDHGDSEGAFLACTCWLADCQHLQGRRDTARRTFERLLLIANDLGLLAEEYDVRARHLCGNFPQGLSHVALVNTALRLCGSVTERGGGPWPESAAIEQDR